MTTCRFSHRVIWGLLLGLLLLGPTRATAQGDSEVPAWASRPMRWANLTFVENDIPNADMQWWIDLYRRAKFDAVVLSAGGVIAYYPTQVPFHYRAANLGDRDFFGEMVQACRGLGMTVVARVDPHAVRQDLAEAHPDWLAVDEKGQKRKHWEAPGRWVTCAYGPMNFEYMPLIIEEIVRKYQVDAIFANRWNGSGMCYCEHCQRQFKEATGYDLPRYKDDRPVGGGRMQWGIEPNDPVWRAYAQWRQERLYAIWDLWDAVVRKANPHARFIPNMGGGIRSVMDMKGFGQRALYLTVDRQARSGLEPPWAIGIAAKEFRAVLGNDKPLGAGFAFGLHSGYRWIDSVNTPEEITIWIAEAVANGIRPSIGKTGLKNEDLRWVPAIEEMFTWHQAHEQYLRNEKPLARVAMVYSQQTAIYADPQNHADHQMGMYQALIEARIPFEMVHDGNLDPQHLAPYRVLILPNIAALSDGQCEQIRAYVQAGGRIVATYETSLYDPWGNKREDFGLGDLFGVRYAGRTWNHVRNSFMRLEWDHPQAGLLQGFEGAQRIINTTRMAGVNKLEVDDTGPLTLIPTYPSLPMEELYPRIERTATPLVYLRQVGSGKVAYVPGDLERTFWELLVPDHARLLKNLVHWALDEPLDVQVIGPGMLDVTHWRQRDSVTVHLVNLTNPMTMRGFYREFLPLGEQLVTLRLPEGTRHERVRLLVAGQEAAVQVLDDGRLSIPVPSIGRHEVVAVDLIQP